MTFKEAVQAIRDRVAAADAAEAAGASSRHRPILLSDFNPEETWMPAAEAQARERIARVAESRIAAAMNEAARIGARNEAYSRGGFDAWLLQVAAEKSAS